MKCSRPCFSNWRKTVSRPCVTRPKALRAATAFAPISSTRTFTVDSDASNGREDALEHRAALGRVEPVTLFPMPCRSEPVSPRFAGAEGGSIHSGCRWTDDNTLLVTPRARTGSWRAHATNRAVRRHGDGRRFLGHLDHAERA